MKNRRHAIVFAAAAALLLCLLRSPNACAQATKTTTGYVEVSDGKLYYEVAGEGHALVFIHGGQFDRRMWDDQWELFAQRFRVIRYDVRGYGKSSIPEKPYSAVDDLDALLNFLHAEKTHLVGLSLGGRISLDFALTHPERVDALILAGPGLTGSPFQGPLDFDPLLRGAQAGDLQKAAELWLKSDYMAPMMESPTLALKARQLALDNAKNWLVNPLPERRLFPPAIDRLGEITAPTLIVVGNRDVTSIHAIMGVLRARIAQSQVVVIPGAGHMVSMEKPADFNKAVLDFLGRLRQP